MIAYTIIKTSKGFHLMIVLELENISDGTNASGNVVRFANRFRADEAVVIFAKTPPDAAYFGYTRYIDSRFDIDCEIRYKNNASLKASCGKRMALFASLTEEAGTPKTTFVIPEMI
mmetsp:Transcript_43324/g.43867  ORF Transcript_43324/g.43867 Transcript_43324/m.43867 type:complete len:116 (+) Transcript_43324:411-758(+)